MSEMDRAISALKNAHKAGDTEAAKKIANAIKAMSRLPPPRKEQSYIGGLAREAAQGALMSGGDELIAGARTILGAKPDDQGGLNWMQFGSGDGISDRYDQNLEFVRSGMSEFQEENAGAATTARVGGAIGGAVLAAPKLAQGAGRFGIQAAQTTAGRGGQMAAGGAAAGAVEGFLAGEGGGFNRLKSAGTSAALGAVFAPIAGYGIAKVANVAEKVGGAALRRVFVNRRFYNPKTGELTDRGVRRLQQLGFDDVESLSAQMQRSFGIAAERATDAGGDVASGATVARMATAENFGVPLTRGQATGDVLQTASEENMRAGARGPGALNTIEGFDRTQRAAVDNARDELILNPSESAPNVIDAADAVTSGVRREAEVARQAGNEAYQALDESGAALAPNAFPNIDRRIQDAVRSEGFAIDGGTPNASAAVSMLRSTFENAQTGSVPFRDIERARQRLVSLRNAAKSGSNGADQVATAAVVREFDGYLDDTITDALIAGDKGVLDQAKNARALWSRYRSTFLSREGADNFIRKIVEDDLAPDEVARWMFGSSENIGGGRTSLVAARVKNILGENSPEWQSVKRAAWDRVTQATEGREAWGPQRVASNISELLSGKGQTLAAELFNEQERRAMGEFRDMLKVLVPPRKATNPSGTSYDVQRATGEMVRNMGVMFSASTGGADAAIGAAVANQAVSQSRGFAATLQARAAARGVTFKPASTSVAIGAGTGLSGSVQDRNVR